MVDAALPPVLSKALQSAWLVYQEALDTRAPAQARRQALRRVAELARAGHDAGWRYPALAEPCEVSPQRVQQIVATHPRRRRTVAAIPEIPQHPRMRPRPKVGPPRRGRLTARERARLGRLAAIAVTVNGSTPVGSKARKDSERLSELLDKLRRDRDVPWADLAEATGSTVTGVRRRVLRHGYGSAPPSLTTYKGVSVRRR